MNKGITLISLVITIIVLLILAGVTITMLTGDNGLINKAIEGKIRAEVSEIIESAKIEEAKDSDFVIEGKYAEKLLYDGEGDFLYNPENVTNVEKEVFESMNIYSLLDLYVYGTYTNNGKTEAMVKGFSDKGLEKLNMGMTKFSIPAKTSDGLEVTKIYDSAFIDCDKIEEMSFPDTLQIIDTKSFSNCSNLKYLDLSNTKVKSIGRTAFNKCTNITEVKAPESLQSVDYYAFEYCSNLVTVYGLNNITYLGSSAFGNCSKLENISLGKITKIYPYCFTYCTNLKNIEIPETVTYISEGAFKYCASLEKVIIPSSVISINYEVWTGCPSIQEIRISSSVVSIGGNCFMGSCTTDAMLYVPFTAAEGAPAGWNSRWNRSKAHFIYSDGTEETDNSKKYM